MSRAYEYAYVFNLYTEQVEAQVERLDSAPQAIKKPQPQSQLTTKILFTVPRYILVRQRTMMSLSTVHMVHYLWMVIMVETWCGDGVGVANRRWSGLCAPLNFTPNLDGPGKIVALQT